MSATALRKPHPSKAINYTKEVRMFPLPVCKGPGICRSVGECILPKQWRIGWLKKQKGWASHSLWNFLCVLPGTNFRKAAEKIVGDHVAMPDLSQNISRRYGYYNGQETNGNPERCCVLNQENQSGTEAPRFATILDLSKAGFLRWDSLSEWELLLICLRSL